jgi:hypothetical protein
MKKPTQLIIAILLIFVMLYLTSCGGAIQRPIEVNITSNKFQVELLFEHDGCKVYRFNDFGKSVYYTNCQGSTTWQTTRHVGKAIHTEQHSVPTSISEN